MELSVATYPQEQLNRHQDKGESGFQSKRQSIGEQFQNLSLQQENSIYREGEVAEEIKHDCIDDGSCNGCNSCDRVDQRNENNGEAKDESEGDRRETENENVGEKERDAGMVGRVERRRRNRYPVRPEAEDCSFYVRTGMCRFEMNCKFNHPPRRNISAVKVKEKDEPSGMPGQVNCKYYDRPGGCRFGTACRFSHSKTVAVASLSNLNFKGLPIRPGEKECAYYMHKGSCKYGADCKFHHPEPTAVEGSDALDGYSNGGSITGQNASQPTLSPWSSPLALNDTASYVPLMFPLTRGVPSNPEWNGYQGTLPLPYGAYSAARTNIYTQQQQPQMLMMDEFPERPGQPECSYFLKTGDCRYRSACKFHHPKSQIVQSPLCALSDLGLPLRPGQNICSYYSRYGICKFGPACKYDHPVNYACSAPSAASGADQSSLPFGSPSMNSKAMVVGNGNRS
ncbi:hypothetical protein Nepgr_033307 [Nepenthes gracilis]|uniref:C3H1-type domain-containing protein n=1 Tax=Nepenthes gracilis TaxID=150966 RepID=A0AAD3TLN3_NEPGR|nr:hypothetical protein Nepgr_033307 [Nepenthes gracilis]